MGGFSLPLLSIQGRTSLLLVPRMALRVQGTTCQLMVGWKKAKESSPFIRNLVRKTTKVKATVHSDDAVDRCVRCGRVDDGTNSHLFVGCDNCDWWFCMTPCSGLAEAENLDLETVNFNCKYCNDSVYPNKIIGLVSCFSMCCLEINIWTCTVHQSPSTTIHDCM